MLEFDEGIRDVYPAIETGNRRVLINYGQLPSKNLQLCFAFC